jgi:hypothetical protein
MGLTPSRERSRAAALVAALEEMLVALKDATVDGDVGWVRPLAVLSAEIEYSALRRSTVDATSLSEECREVRALLAGPSRADADFASRYARARHTSPAVAKWHDRALAACRDLSRAAA